MTVIIVAAMDGIKEEFKIKSNIKNCIKRRENKKSRYMKYIWAFYFLYLIFVAIVLIISTRTVEAENKKIDIEIVTDIEEISSEVLTEITSELTTHIIEETQLNSWCYTDEDLILLAKVINIEAGDDCTDEHKMYVGQVVLNRILDDRFPNTLEAVIYQTEPTKQYACTDSSAFQGYPSERSIECAYRLLNGEKICNEDIIWQSEFPQGITVKVFKTKYSTTYFGK